MKHVPVLLCSGAMLAAATLPPACAREVAHNAAPMPRASQRAAPLNASGAAEQACLAMIADDPQGALDRAEDWSHHGGADAADRCRALATVGLGDPDKGGALLEGLSHDTGLSADRRAMLAGEAAQAWLLASKPDRAFAASALAMELDPSPDHVIEHARAALAARQPLVAIRDLAPVLKAHPDLAEALVVRASALAQTGALAQARQDIDAACRLVPDAADALLERGVLREQTGDLDGARSDWSRVIATSPDTHEADLAQQDLALLDAGPEAR